MSLTLADHPVFDPGILGGFHLLESDAGTGKTWTIAGLVVRALVERELELDRILVVTFTSAATAELAARIRERIEAMATLLDDRLAGRPLTVDELFCRAFLERLERDAGGDPHPRLDRALRRLRVALSRIDEAAVHTIHGFCQRVIDEHALTIGVPAGIEAGDTGAAWVDALVADWWRRNAVPASAPELSLLADWGVTPQWLASLVRAIHANPAAVRPPAPHDWRALAASLAGLREQLAGAIASGREPLLAWIGVKGNANGSKLRVDWTASKLDRLAAWCAPRSGSAALSRKERAQLLDDATKLSTEFVMAARTGESTPPAAITDRCAELARLLPACDAVAGAIATQLWDATAVQRLERRASGAMLGFDDLLLIVRDALADPAAGDRLAHALRERHPLALIDECQDTDALQWEIFGRIHLPDGREPAGGLVLVGDPKQAIYAFRGADVYSYLEARNAGPCAHALRENQRSVRGLIEAVNALFGAGRPFGVAGIDFAPAGVGKRPRRELQGADADGRAPMTILRFGADAADVPLTREAATTLAVAATVAEIDRLLRAGLRLDDRPVEPGDIAVLVDSHAQGSHIKRALARAGIGAVEVSRDRVVDSPEAADLMRWLAAAADPADAGLARSALAATPGGFDAAALEALSGEPARWAAWVGMFAACRDDWARLGPQAALRRLLFGSGAVDRLSALRDGERRLTNWLHLLELLAASDDASQGPRQAWRWLSRARGDDGPGPGREAAELRLDSDENLVRILTVHKSKGLEFPFVFLPFAWSGKEPGSTAPLVHHVGPGSRSGESPHWRAVLELNESPAEQVLEQAVAEQRAEGVRRLYVALTRAEQRCHLLWGPVSGMRDAPLARILAGMAGVQAIDEKPAKGKSAEHAAALAAALDAAAEAWRDRAPPGSVAITGGGPTPVVAEPFGARGLAQAADDAAAGDPDEGPRARRFGGTIPAPWIRTSFTAMVARLADGQPVAAGLDDDERPDHDQGIDSGVQEGVAQAIRFAFPAGARAGSCLHGVLEECDLPAPIERGLVARWLARAGFHDVDPAPVAAWLDEVLDAPLRAPDGRQVPLRALRPGACVRELEFHLAGRAVDERALLEAVASEYPIVAEAPAGRWDGFLRGFVDLVFEHEGRWYVLDWKSNRLGDRLEDYGLAAVDAAMRAHMYSLQACLYLLVLHRFLRTRLPGYDWDSHVGGAFWVFLRGYGAGDVPDPSLGLHSSRPSRALIERLDRLFDGRGGAR